MMKTRMMAQSCDLLEMPYFLTNKDWYYYDDKDKICKLTDKAPEKARKSYEDFYNSYLPDKNGMVTLL